MNEMFFQTFTGEYINCDEVLHFSVERCMQLGCYVLCAFVEVEEYMVECHIISIHTSSHEANIKLDMFLHQLNQCKILDSIKLVKYNKNFLH